jgi:cystathionine beta-lyase
MHSLDESIPPELGLGTLLSHWAEDSFIEGAVAPPIFQNSIFAFERMEDLLSSISKVTDGPPHFYSRIGNPTVNLAEAKLAKLEGTDAAKVFGSGMAAISAAVLNTVKAGDHVIAPDTVYGPVRSLLTGYLQRFGISVTYVVGTSVEEILDAIRPETTLIYLESPTSLLFRLMDIPAITTEARSRGITTIFDNSYSTPVFLKPAALGVDLVCHSVTKYLAGHSDITAGVVCGSQDRINDLVKNEVNLLGGILHPFPSWLLIRGLRTLKVRMKQHEQSANEIAAWLEARPEVERVHHISLDSFPQLDLYQSMFRGSTGLFAIEPKVQDRARIFAFADDLKLFAKAISWGGYESLVVALPVKPMDFDETRWIVRFSIGLEEPEDLIADLQRSIEKHFRES